MACAMGDVAPSAARRGAFSCCRLHTRESVRPESMVLLMESVSTPRGARVTRLSPLGALSSWSLSPSVFLRAGARDLLGDLSSPGHTSAATGTSEEPGGATGSEHCAQAAPTSEPAARSQSSLLSRLTPRRASPAQAGAQQTCGGAPASRMWCAAQLLLLTVDTALQLLVAVLTARRLVPALVKRGLAGMLHVWHMLAPLLWSLVAV